MREFKSRLFNRLNIAILPLMLFLACFLIFVIYVGGLKVIFGYFSILLLCLLFFVSLFFASKQKIMFDKNKITQSSLFGTRIVRYSDITEIKEGIYNPLIRRYHDPDGGGIVRTGNYGLNLISNNKNLLLITRYNFSKDWDSIKSIIQKNSKKRIKIIP